MRRLARFIVRSWPLKVGAIGLAVILYGGMVILQSTTVWPGTIAITPTNYPADSTLIGSLQSVGNIRYVAPPEVPITVSSFSATIDLSKVKAGQPDQPVNVNLVAVDQRIQIIDFEPKQVSVTLEPITTITVPVVVNTGAVPTDVQPGTPVAKPSTVTIKGAARYVREVAYAKAAVRIDASGLDVSQDVELGAADVNGATVNNVTITPPTVHVSIQVASQLRTETVPVSPAIINSPATGYYVTGVDITPSTVLVEGQADALSHLKAMALTKPISIAGATGDVSVTVGLDLPADVTALGTTVIQVVVHLRSPETTRTVAIGLVTTGGKSGMLYSLSTYNATVTIGGATAALNAFDTSSLVGVVDVSSLGPGTSSAPIAVTLPAGIKLVSINPATVTVTVTAPATPPPSSAPSSSAKP